MYAHACACACLNSGTGFYLSAWSRGISGDIPRVTAGEETEKLPDGAALVLGPNFLSKPQGNFGRVSSTLLSGPRVQLPGSQGRE